MHGQHSLRQDAPLSAARKEHPKAARTRALPVAGKEEFEYIRSEIALRNMTKLAHLPFQ